MPRIVSESGLLLFLQETTPSVYVVDCFGGSPDLAVVVADATLDGGALGELLLDEREFDFAGREEGVTNHFVLRHVMDL